MRRIHVLAGLLVGLNLFASLIAAFAVALSDTAENSNHHVPWLLRHVLDGGPASVGWWLAILLPPLFFYLLARNANPASVWGIWALVTTATLAAFAMMFF